jgi:AbiU2
MVKNSPADDSSIVMVDRFLGFVLDLEVKVHEYRSLFENQKLYPLLKDTSFIFFTHINSLYIDSILLDIGKITDPAESYDFENFTVSNLIHSIDWGKKAQRKLNKLEQEVLSFRCNIKDVRNKLLAHLDKKSVLENSTLGTFPYEDGNTLLKNLKEILNICHFESKGYDTSFKLTQEGDVIDFITAIKQSEAFNRIFKDGDIDERSSLLDLMDKIHQDYS